MSGSEAAAAAAGGRRIRSEVTTVQARRGAATGWVAGAARLRIWVCMAVLVGVWGTAMSGSASAAQAGAGSCTSRQLLTNPGFESGNTGWTASSGVIQDWTASNAHSGSWEAWLDGYGTTHTDTLYQSVTIPSGCKATLAFWLNINTAETTKSTAFDKLTVTVRNSSGTVLSTLATYSNLDATSGYVQKSFNLSTYAGQTVTLEFVGAEDSSLQTSFFIDDTALTTG
jgi:hypothetical protein